MQGSLEDNEVPPPRTLQRECDQDHMVFLGEGGLLLMSEVPPNQYHCKETLAKVDSYGWKVTFRSFERTAYRGTSLIRNRHPLGPHTRTMPWDTRTMPRNMVALGRGGCVFL